MTRNKIMLIGLMMMTMLVLQACNSGAENKPSTQPTPSKPAPSPTTSPGFAAGDKAMIDNSHTDTPYVTVAVTEQDLDEYIKAINAQDLIGATELSLSKRLFRVPNETRVLVLETKGMKTNIRIRNGKEALRAGWVLTPVVKAEK